MDISDLPRIDVGAPAPAVGIAATMLRRISGDPPPVLFHYTSASGLKGILDSTELWASDTRFLNDRTEVKHGAELCRTALRQVDGESPFAEMCRLLPERLKAEEFVFFSASFCIAGDLIPQWRGYAAGGAGYALGVATEALVDRDEYFLLRVIYDDREKQDAIASMIAAHEEAWKPYEELPVEQKREIIAYIATALLSGLTALSVCFKPAVFSYEQEWRIVGAASQEHPSQLADVKFRDTESAIVPYLSLPLTREHVMPFQRICVGPMQRNEAAASAVELYANHKGYQIDVQVSEAPLRH